jgi:hypothetical protein
MNAPRNYDAPGESVGVMDCVLRAQRSDLSEFRPRVRAANF